MTFNKLMRALNKHAVCLQRDGGHLIILGEEETLTPALLSRLSAYKAELLDLVDRNNGEWKSPGFILIPEMLPLVELTQAEIDTIVAGVPGGAANIQDIYPLTTLQEGILFHHLMDSRGDAYLLYILLAFDTRDQLEGVLGALREVIARHDILRTAVVWEGLREPVQVVWREAPLPVAEVALDAADGEAADQLRERIDPRRVRLDLRQAPLMRCVVAQDAARGRWLLLWLHHHLVSDHSTLEMMIGEAQAILLGERDRLPEPLPFRNLVAQARLGGSREEQERFFREMLGDVDEPTAPYGLLEAQGDEMRIEEARIGLERSVGGRLRERARALGVSAASLCHVAWARVLGRVCGREDVVFGTVLFGRMGGGEGAERTLGLFMNTLPIRVRVGAESVERCVRRTHELLGELMRHEHASLALAQKCSGVKAPTPLFSSLLNYRHSRPEGKQSAEGTVAWAGIEALGSEERTNYPLTVSVDDLGEGFTLTAQAMRPMEAVRICEYLRVALKQLAEALEREPETEVRALEVLPEAERRQLLDEWNETRRECPGEKCVHHLFEEQVERSPEAVALSYEDEQLSYAELNARANRVAHHLRGLGVGPGRRVAICVEQSIEMVIAVLATLKSGGAYVPLDPAYPVDRLAYMLEESAPVVLLTHGAARMALSDRLPATPILDLEGDAGQWAGQSEMDPKWSDAGPGARSLAYIIYTSGSTGLPKGVMIDHGGVVNLLSSMQQTVSAGPGDCVLWLTTLAFDIAGLELYLPLISGARIELAGNGNRHDPARLAERMVRAGVTAVQATPATWRMLLEAGCKGMEEIKALCGGEALPVEQARRIRERVGRLWNVYGPTETTIWSTVAEVDAASITEAEGHITIGRPIANTSIYILDRHLCPAPIGVAADMHIGGAGVAWGYLNRPELTAERFLPDPYSLEAGARIYRTGDLSRWLPEGEIEFLGRNDFQVKVRGFRIELGEIETRLMNHPEVREAVVLAREDEEGGKRLVAYYTGAAVGAGALRAHLSSALPEYMAPAAYVHLESLPLTPNGKLDRKALPDPEGGAYVRRGYEPPVGEAETRLAQIWAELLKVERVSRHDNFFELGGHSLLALQALSQLRQALGAEVPLAALFAQPVLADFALTVGRASQTELPPIISVDRNQPLELSFAQQRLWFLAQLEGASEAYHIAGGLRLVGDLDRAALQRALDRIVARHEALRTAFSQIDGRPVQVIGPAETGFLLAEEDLRYEAEPQAELRRLVAEEARRPFDLEAGPLIRGRLARLGDEEHALLVTMHHIVSDGWSMGILVNELSRLYRSYSRGQADSLPALPVQYADYAAWQRRWLSGQVWEEQAAYWKKALAGAPALLELPTDRPRPAQQDFAGEVVEIEFEAGLTRELKALGRRHGATMYMTLLAGWAALLSRLSGQEEVVIGSPVANRMRAEIEPLIGFFVNTLALRIDLSGSPSVVELLERVKQRTLEGQQHQELPFEQVVEIVEPPRSLGHTPVFQVALAWQNAPAGELELPGLRLALLEPPQETSRYDLSLTLQESERGIVGGLEYAAALFDRETVERYLGYWRVLLEGMVSDEWQAVDRLPVMGEAERRQVIEEWNETEAEYPRERCVHDLFEEQAEKSPAAIALVEEDRSLSYRELNARANQLAHHLWEMGVRPEARVAILLERSMELVIAELAALKCGAAYMPLDRNAPSGRQAMMIEDCQAEVVLTVKGEKVPAVAGVRRVDLEGTEGREEEMPNLGLEVRSKTAAYVIYTSGSTGQPKGVVIPHCAIGRLALNNCYASFEVGDRVAFTSNPAFDASTMEVWAPLLHGGCLVVIPETVLLDATALGLLLRRQEVSILHLVAGLLGAYADRLTSVFPHLRYLLTGGDAVDPQALIKILRTGPPQRLIHCYGPSESTTFATTREVREVPEKARRIPIGRAIANTQIYLLDRTGQPVPLGVIGELYIGGAGVGRGYLNRPELTAERFLPDPFG